MTQTNLLNVDEQLTVHETGVAASQSQLSHANQSYCIEAGRAWETTANLAV